MSAAIHHHPPEELLLEYAAGASTEGEALILATHLSLCPACRALTERLEVVGAGLMSAAPAAEIDPGMFDALLARLDEPAPPPLVAPLPPPPPGGVLPAPLRRYVGAFADLRWKTRIPGRISEVTLPIEQNGFPVRLLRSKAGWSTPKHTHGGPELSMVLTGGFTDGDEHYERGDFCQVDDEVAHHNVFDPGEDCVTLVIAEAPMVPLDLAGKLAKLFTSL